MQTRTRMAGSLGQMLLCEYHSVDGCVVWEGGSTCIAHTHMTVCSAPNQHMSAQQLPNSICLSSVAVEHWHPVRVCSDAPPPQQPATATTTPTHNTSLQFLPALRPTQGGVGQGVGPGKQPESRCVRVDGCVCVDACVCWCLFAGRRGVAGRKQGAGKQVLTAPR